MKIYITNFTFIIVLFLSLLLARPVLAQEEESKTEPSGTVDTYAAPPIDDGGGDGGGGGTGTEPDRPPAPTVSSNYCGYKTLTRVGDPPSGVAWTWQNANGSGYEVDKDGRTLTVTSTATYYLRPLKVSGQIWGPPSSSVTATVRYVAPPTAPSVQVNGCKNATLTRGSRTGETWYWQTAANGTSQSNSSVTYTVYTSGTYYLRARNNTSGCWSSAVSIPVTLAPGPATPPAPTVSYEDGIMYLTRVEREHGSDIWYYWKDSNGNNLGTANPLAGNPNAIYYLYAHDKISDCWSSGVGAGMNPADIPPAPTGISVSTNACGPKTLTVNQPSSWANYVFYWQGKNSNGKSTSGDGTYSAQTDGTYYVRGKHKTKDIWGPNASVTVDVNPSPEAPVAINKRQYGKGFVKFETTNANGSYYWYNNPSDPNPISTTPSATIVELVSSTTVKYAQSYTEEGCYSAMVPVQVEVLQFPEVKVIGQAGINFQQEWVELTTDQPYDQYQWYKNGNIIEGATQRNYKAASAGFYAVEVKNTGFNKKLKSDPFRVAHMLEDENRTYSISTQVLVPGAKTKGDVIRLSAEDKLQSISYYDDYGRIEQQLAIKASPDGKDMVSVHQYDDLGRESKRYMSFTNIEGTGMFLEDWETQLNNFYQAAGDGIANTLTPFAEVAYENSPLGRVKKSGAQGAAWQLNGAHTNTYDYQLNNGTENIRIWSIDETTGLPVSTATYAAGQLSVQAATDEHGITTKSYSAPEGYTILQEEALQAQTYAVYDKRGRMRFVLQPELVKNLNASGTYQPTAQQINNFAFQYLYDEKGRMVATKTPGADWIYVVYDESDKPVLSQDGNQRVNGQWLFVKYDVFDRPVSSGVYNDAASREEMQRKIDRYYNQKIVWEQFTGSAVVDGHLQKTAQTEAWGDAGASSAVVLENGQDGTLHFEVTDLTHKYMIGFSDTDVDAHYNSIDYAIYIDRTRFYVYHNGNKVWHTGILEKGDIFQIERKGGEIRFKQNGSVFYTFASANTGPLVVDAAIYTAGGQIDTDVTIDSFEQQGNTYFGYSDMAFPQIADQKDFLNIGYYDDYSFPHASAIEYTYVPDEENPSYFDRVKGLVTGSKTRILGEEIWINTVNYYDDEHRNIQSVSNNHKEGVERMESQYDFTGKVLETKISHTLPVPVIWKNTVNVEQNGSVFTSTANVNWGAGMASANQLRADEDGWVETTVISFGNKFLGFSEWDNGVSFNDIDFAIYMNGRNLKAYRKGAHLATIGEVEIGDKLMIERVQGVVMIYHNGSPAYTFTDLSTGPLVIDASLQQSVATLGYIGCSFGIPAPAEPPYEVLWASRHGNTFTDNTLTKQHFSNSWDIGGSFSFNKLDAEMNGWVTFPAGQTDIDKMIGLAHEDQGSRYNDINYAIYLKSNGTIGVFEKDDDKGSFGSYSSGDIFKIERVHGEIRYLKNDQVFYTSTTPSEESLIVDVSIYSQGGFFTDVKTSFPYLQPKSEAIDIAQKFNYDRVGRLLKATHELSEAVKWEGLNGLELSGDNSLTHVGLESYPNSGAYSRQVLRKEGNGFFKVTAENKDRVLIGLNDEPAGTDYRDMDYAIYLPTDGKLYIYENGVRQTAADNLATYDIGDKISIVKKGTTIFYQKNGSTFYTSAKPVVADLYPDVTTYYQGDKITGAMVSTSGEILLAENRYNELGQLIEKNLHQEKENQPFAQSVDYRYNIRGWIRSINSARLTADSETNPADSRKDFWGMELAYEDAAGTGNASYFNGNISAMKTSYNLGLGEVKEQAYNFTYDDQNRLTDATYKAGAANIWAAKPGHYDVKDVQYDLNGNIRRLSRFAGHNDREKIDDLVYDYQEGTEDFSNRLLKLSDNSGSTFKDEGFKNEDGDDFTYDANGNITSDNNKGIAAISYNFMNMPEQIVKLDGSKVTFSYDAGGRKLAKQVYDPSGKLVKRTDYIGAFTYDNDTLQYIHHQQGRIVPDKVNGGWEYQYYLSDQLGNIRTVFTTKEKVLNFKATMETETEQDENEIFTNLDKSRTVDTEAVSGDEVSRLNSSQMAGPGISLPVYPGDKIDMQVYAYHRGGSGNANPVDLTNFIAAVAGAFGGMNGGGTLEQATYNVMQQAIDPAAGGFGLIGTQNDLQPAAYLNYILFNKDFTVRQHGHAQIQPSANAPHKLVIDNITSDVEGFIYIYLSNESNTLNEVYFDDLEVTLTEGKVIQSTDYYPFGLQQNTSWTRMDQTPNAHKFNAGTEYNDFTDTYDTPFRQYDPATGRFNGVDALAHMAPSLTPYRFGFNNPVSFNDPTGLMERPIILDTDRTNGGGGSILSGADNFGSMAFLTGKMGIGSGRFHRSYGYSGSGGTSVSSISRRLMNSAYGGTWSSSGGYSYFSSHGEAFGAGVDYNKYHQSWGNVPGGHSGAMERGVSAGLVRNKKVKKVVDQFGGYIWRWKYPKNEGIGDMSYPKTTFEVLHSWADSDDGWDWFVETTQHSHSYYTQTAVIIFYNTNPKDWGSSKYGQEIYRVAKTRSLIMDAGGLHPHKDLPYKPSQLMKEYIQSAKDWHCGGCLSEPTLWDKYWKYITTPRGNQKGGSIPFGVKRKYKH